MLYLTPAITAYFLILAALLGLVLGSFCNAWAWRLAHGEAITRGRSHCAVCGHVLGPLDLVPLFSWLFLRGRCRYCHAPISKRYPAVEALFCLYCVSILLAYDISWATLRFFPLGCLLLTACLVDWEIMELPDGLLAAAALCALLRLAEEGWRGLVDGLFGGVVVALPLLGLVLAADRLLGKESMGGGDIKLMAVLGLHFGWAKALLLLIAACVIGLVMALPARKKDGESRPFPFGPALGLAAWFTALFGGRIISAYLALFF